MNENDDLDSYAAAGLLLKPLASTPSVPPGELTYLAGGAVDDAAITLRFFGATLDPDQLSFQLGRSPTTARRKGERVREHWIATTGVWFLRLPRHEEDLEAQIDDLLQHLPHDQQLWNELQPFSGELFCRLSCRTWNRALGLSAALCQRLAQRHLSLALDIYFEPDDDPEERGA